MVLVVAVAMVMIVVMMVMVPVGVAEDLAVGTDVFVPMVVIMPMIMVMNVIMIVVMVMMVAVRVAGFDFRFAFGAAADRAHHSTSNSLTRNSSPPVTTSWCPPQSGQGSNRSASGTCFSHARQKA